MRHANVLTIRGPGLFPGLVSCLLLACGEAGPGPVSEPAAEVHPPDRETIGGVETVRNHAAAATLTVYGGPPSTRADLLFLEGRSATPLAGGGSAWADLDGARLVLFDERGRVVEVFGGAPREGPPLMRPAFVSSSAHGLLAVEVDGQALQFEGDAGDVWVTPRLPAAEVGGTGELTAATRTVFDIATVPLAPGEPLLWIGKGKEVLPVDSIDMPDQALLAPVTNAGWVAPHGNRGVYFASAMRPELHRYDADGRLAWIATWQREGVREPRFGVSGGTLTPVFRLIQQAVVVGPDDHVYVLATTGEEGPANRLLVFSDDGELVREATIEPRAAIYVGERGHVYAMPPDQALALSAADPERRAFEPFDLPELHGEGRIRLADHLGKVVVVNFWASWCVPCRIEIPLLQEMASAADPEQLAVNGLNEDLVPSAARAFLAELGGVAFPMAEGRGRLERTYGYRGLPYTVVLDREGRVVRAFHGFGRSIEPLARVVRAELESTEN